MFLHTGGRAGVRMERNLDGRILGNRHLPIRAELEFHVVCEQRGSHLGK